MATQNHLIATRSKLHKGHIKIKKRIYINDKTTI